MLKQLGIVQEYLAGCPRNQDSQNQKQRYLSQEGIFPCESNARSFVFIHTYINIWYMCICTCVHAYMGMELKNNEMRMIINHKLK